jgi:hypothetical protein
VSWSRRAAELALRRYEIDDALTLLHRAVELEPLPERQAALWYEIGHANALKYAGEAFVSAMEQALALGAPEAMVYPELAYQTAMRAGMWQKRLDDSLVEGWIARSVEVAPETGPLRIRALVAHAYRHDDADVARTALALANEANDPELRSDAMGALQSALEEKGLYVDALAVASERADLLPAVTNPDHRADAFHTSAMLHVGMGRLPEARIVTRRMEETVAGLTPHHRVHGLEMRVRLETAVGDWDAMRSLTPRIEEAIEANLATPCPFNVGGLLTAAVAAEQAGDRTEANRLVAKAESIGMIGYELFLAVRRLRLALARETLDEVRQIEERGYGHVLTPGNWELWAAHLDALVALDERERIEAEAPAWIRPDTYVAPFALRALGIARADSALIAESAERFAAMGLDWDAERTRSLDPTRP